LPALPMLPVAYRLVFDRVSIKVVVIYNPFSGVAFFLYTLLF
jgi:hypothetical protein